jgi:hypothetical protein
MSAIDQTADWSAGYPADMMRPQRPDWRYLAEQASKEADPVKLMSLVEELNRALEQNEQTSKLLQTQHFV